VKEYDRAYFDRWYRDTRQRVVTPTTLARRVAWIVATSEYILQRRIRNVLDVGCGEGHWAAAIHRLRPRAAYTGVDPSPYVISRYGARRHILQGKIEDLDSLPLAESFDVIVCCAALNYLPPAVVGRGLAHISDRLEGVAHIEIFSPGDPVEGDFRGWRWYSPRWVRQRVRDAHLIPIGLQCYVRREHASELNALELGH